MKDWKPTPTTWFLLAVVALVTFSAIAAVSVSFQFQRVLIESERLGYERGRMMMQGVKPPAPPKRKGFDI